MLEKVGCRLVVKIASHVSLHLVLALTASPGFLSVDLDATSAFVSAPLQDNEQVYMTAVPGYPLLPGYCLHVVKSTYRLATALLAFYNLCIDVFGKVGLQRLRTDECVFIKYAYSIKTRTLMSRLSLQTSTSSIALLMYLKAIGSTPAALTLSTCLS
jgi:hypothetical protein